MYQRLETRLEPLSTTTNRHRMLPVVRAFSISGCVERWWPGMVVVVAIHVA
jgi:hypothetical protein